MKTLNFAFKNKWPLAWHHKNSLWNMPFCRVEGKISSGLGIESSHRFYFARTKKNQLDDLQLHKCTHAKLAPTSRCELDEQTENRCSHYTRQQCVQMHAVSSQKILLRFTAFVNFDNNAYFVQVKIFKIVTMGPFIYYVSKRQNS